MVRCVLRETPASQPAPQIETHNCAQYRRGAHLIVRGEVERATQPEGAHVLVVPLRRRLLVAPLADGVPPA